jgi:hypothetical protein
MVFRLRSVSILILGCLIMAACTTSNAAQQPTRLAATPVSTTEPTHTPAGATAATEQNTTAASAEPEPGATPEDTEAEEATEAEPVANTTGVFAPGSTIGEVDISGFDTSEAVAELNAQMAAVLILPLEVRANDEQITISPNTISLRLPAEELVAEAWAQQEAGEPVDVPLRFDYDEEALRSELSSLLDAAHVTPAIDVISEEIEYNSSTQVISRSFAYRPGKSLEVDEAVEQFDEHMASPQASRTLVLEMFDTTDEALKRPSFAEIQEQVNQQASEWDGVAGFYLYDIESGQTITHNANTVFSAASVMKVAILLHAYVSLPSFTPEEREAIQTMIINSDNLRANDVLAATMHGSGTDDAYVGVLTMNKMLSDLGFQHTYMNMPYEGYDYLVGLRGLEIRRGPEQEGMPPFTAADPILRTTPAEISRIFLMIDECSKGTGVLLARYPQQLSPDRCQEMLDLLAQNADDERMVAPIPEGVRVEHKSGWVQDMHADVGIVRSPGGDYLMAVYLWRGVDELPDLWTNPHIVAFSRLIYTAYNPLEL